LVQSEVKKMFQERFSVVKDFGVRLGNVDFKNPSSEDKTMLTAKITKEEIRDVVWKCEGAKSLRSDEFNFSFIKNTLGFKARYCTSNGVF